MKTIVLISRDTGLTDMIERILRKSYRIVIFSTMQSALDHVYNSTPALMVTDIDFNDRFEINILNYMKENPIFSQLPVLALLGDTLPATRRWKDILVEDYLRRSDVERDLAYRVDLCVLRSERVMEINPLTRLPGNIAINKQIQGRLDRSRRFALAYADLDHFKPFNDYYGFSRGDDVLKMTGRLILNTVKGRQPKGSFVGHIGGDDFVFIMDLSLVEQTAEEIVDTFDRIVPTFYDAQDKDRKSIRSLDRQGNMRKFSIISVSIGIAHNKYRSFTHYGELTEIASELKGHAKRHKGSCYRLDKRQEP